MTWNNDRLFFASKLIEISPDSGFGKFLLPNFYFLTETLFQVCSTDNFKI